MEIGTGGIGFLFGADSVSIFVFFLKFGFIPAELSSGMEFERLNLDVGQVQSIASPIPTWATIFTSMFIHGGLMHFAGNMLFLWVFGDNIEDTFGHVKYLVFYLVAGVLATLAHYVTDMGSQTPLVGASGGDIGRVGRLSRAVSSQPHPHADCLLPDHRRGAARRLAAAHMDRLTGGAGPVVPRTSATR